jgi:hypothetical protein
VDSSEKSVPVILGGELEVEGSARPSEGGIPTSVLTSAVTFKARGGKASEEGLNLLQRKEPMRGGLLSLFETAPGKGGVHRIRHVEPHETNMGSPRPGAVLDGSNACHQRSEKGDALQGGETVGRAPNRERGGGAIQCGGGGRDV